MAPFSTGSSIGFIGAGNVGGSLAVALSQRDYRVVAAASRTFASSGLLAERVAGCTAYHEPQDVVDACDVVFITTTDAAIGPVSASASWRRGQGVVHCSGAASLDVFEEAARQGALPGAFHPLQAFSSVEHGSKSFPGTTFGIEGDTDMKEFLSQVALDLGGHPVFLRPEDKPLYHLSGVMMGNLLTTLAAVAAQLWDNLGLTRADGVRALAPMMRQVSYNLESMGVPGAVAGPYPRGDIGTVRKHLQTLEERAPGVLPLYCELALTGLPYAVEKGTLARERAEEIRQLVEEFKVSSAGGGPCV